MKLLIAIPTVDYIHHMFVESLVKLSSRLTSEGIEHDICFQSGTLLYLERDALVWKAIDGGYTHMLWLDADMVFDEDVFDKLYKTGKDFVSSVYVSRHGKNGPVLFDNLGLSHRFESYPDDTFRIEGCGFGCVLMKTDIPEYIMNQYGTCFVPNRDYGEDLAFCEKVLKHNFEMWATSKVFVGHIGHTVFFPEPSSR